MSAATMAQHSPLELTYCGTAQGVAVFSSASKSRPGQRNWTYVTVDTLEVACECHAPSGTCYHVDWALTALAMTQVAGFVGGLTDAALVEVGGAAGAKVEAGTASVTDTAVYWASKREFCLRKRAARAVVAEWDSLSHSDRAIDAGYGGLTAYVVARDTLAALVAA